MITVDLDGYLIVFVIDIVTIETVLDLSAKYNQMPYLIILIRVSMSA